MSFIFNMFLLLLQDRTPYIITHITHSVYIIEREKTGEGGQKPPNYPFETRHKTPLVTKLNYCI